MPQFGSNPYQNPQMNQMGQGGQWNRQQTPTMTGGQQWFGGGNNQQFGGNNGWNNTQPNAGNYQGGGQSNINQGAWNNPQQTQNTGSWLPNNTNQQLRTQPTTGYGNYIPQTQNTGQDPMIDPIDTTGIDPTGTTGVDPAAQSVPGFVLSNSMLGKLNHINTLQNSITGAQTEDRGFGALAGGNGFTTSYGQIPQRDTSAYERQLAGKSGEIENWLRDQYNNVYGGDKDAMMQAMQQGYTDAADRSRSERILNSSQNQRSVLPMTQAGYRDNWMGENQGNINYLNDLMSGIWGGVMNYYDALIEQLMEAGVGSRDASRGASQLEDNMLRRQLQAKYKKGKGDGRPSGIYAGAEFPGMQYQLWQLESGMMPKLGKWDPGESQLEEKNRRRKQEEFARFQRQMLGMGGGQPRRNSTILDRRQRYRR